jgi:hypothetical protein
MRRVYRVDVLKCPHCGGQRKVLDFLLEGAAIRRILTHLGLDTEPPAIAPARAPPEPVLPFA